MAGCFRFPLPRKCIGRRKRETGAGSEDEISWLVADARRPGHRVPESVGSPPAGRRPRRRSDGGSAAYACGERGGLARKKEFTVKRACAPYDRDPLDLPDRVKLGLRSVANLSIRRSTLVESD